MHRRTLAPLVLALAALPATAAAQAYRSSVTGTDFDFITDEDPSAFTCLESHGELWREMPDKTGPTELIQRARVFVAYYSDGTSVDLALDLDLGDEEATRAEALRYAPRLGKLPTALRRGVHRLVVHAGHPDATAFADRGVIALYSANATKRIATHDLEETLFHEAVHAAWDERHEDSPDWRAAQAADGAFVTRYARENPDGEDLAESALFAYTLAHHPGRIPPADAAALRATIPARIAFVRALLPPDEPILYPVRAAYPCDGTGETFTKEAPAVRDPAAPDACSIDLDLVGVLADIVSNALTVGLDYPEDRVRPFLDAAQERCRTPEELLQATVREFDLDRRTLNVEVEDFFHCNCAHPNLGDSPGDAWPILRSTPTADVADAVGETPATAAPVATGDEPAPTVLYVIAGLLGLLLVVNAATLALLARRTASSARADPHRTGRS